MRLLCEMKSRMVSAGHSWMTNVKLSRSYVEEGRPHSSIEAWRYVMGVAVGAVGAGEVGEEEPDL